MRSVEVKRVWNSAGLINNCKQAKRGKYGSIFFEEEKRSNRDGRRTTENGRGSKSSENRCDDSGMIHAKEFIIGL